MSGFRAWESWAIYPSDFLIKLQNIFLGLVRTKPTTEIDNKKSTFDEDIDGKPINLESSDNRPLALVADYDDEEDIDGKPISNIDNDIDGRPLNLPKESRPRFREEAEENSSSSTKARFVPTKWQSIDPTEVAAQAVTISKWDFDQESAVKGTESLYEDLAETSRTSNENNNTNNDEYIRNNSSTSTHNNENTIVQDSLSTSDMSEERRQKLRDVEIQVLKYTDELESGRREPAYGLSLAEEIEIYRQNLLKKIEEEEKSTAFSSPDSSKSSNRNSISNKQQTDSSRTNSSRYSQQRSIDEKNQETISRRDDSSSRHRSTSARSNSSNSSQSESSTRLSSSRTNNDHHHHHHQHKRKRDERSPSPSSRHSRSNRR
jgi:U2-associated protein SR140